MEIHEVYVCILVNLHFYPRSTYSSVTEYEDLAAAAGV